MNFTAPRRPGDVGRTTTQLTQTRRDRRRLPTVRRAERTGRLEARWRATTDGRLILLWSLARPTHPLINRKRGSDA
jgi:hypothetical protein